MDRLLRYFPKPKRLFRPLQAPGRTIDAQRTEWRFLIFINDEFSNCPKITFDNSRSLVRSPRSNDSESPGGFELKFPVIVAVKKSYESGQNSGLDHIVNWRISLAREHFSSSYFKWLWKCLVSPVRRTLSGFVIFSRILWHDPSDNFFYGKQIISRSSLHVDLLQWWGRELL